MSPLLDAGLVKGMAHITGGGITENLPRVLPDGCAAAVDRRRVDGAAALPAARSERGQIATDEMFRAFNMGIGLIIVCRDEDAARRVIRACSAARANQPIVLGRVAPGDGDGPLRGLALVNRRIGVLISGRGVEPAIDHRRDRRRHGWTRRIAVVVSNRREAAGLDRARDAGIEALSSSTRAIPPAATNTTRRLSMSAARAMSSWSVWPASCGWWGQGCSTRFLIAS